MAKSKQFKLIYYGYYEINRQGVIRRVKPAVGTWPGRVLKAYYPGKGGTVAYIKLCRKGIEKQYRVEDLIHRAFK